MQKIVKHKNQNFDSAAAYDESSDEFCGYSYGRCVNTLPVSSICFLWQLFLVVDSLYNTDTNATTH